MTRYIHFRLSAWKVFFGMAVIVFSLDGECGRAQEGGGDPGSSAENQQITVSVAQSGSGDWSNSAEIAAGAISSEAHQADVQVTTPNQPDTQVTVSLEGGNGYQSPAELDMSDGTVIMAGDSGTVTTDDNGQISGTLTSSDVLESVTINASAGGPSSGSASVNFAWDNYTEDDAWVADPEEVAPGDSSDQTVILEHDGYAMDQHDLLFCVTEVQYIDDDGNVQTVDSTPDNPQDLSQWATFEDQDCTTDSDGSATATVDLADDDSIVSITMTYYDQTVWNTDSGPDGD